MKINVHGGHNKYSTGASSVLNELTENRKVKDLVISKLRALGHTVYDCTDDAGTSQNKNLKNIVSKCNAHKVDIDISIHFNSGAKNPGGNGKTTGTEVYYYSSKGKAYAQKVVNAIAELGFKNRGAKSSSTLYVLKHTDSPAILIECCFVDDRDDANLYNAEKMANAIVKGLTGQASTATSNSNTSNNASANTAQNSVNYKVKVNTPSGVNCRKEPNAGSEKITAYANGTELLITKESGNWGYTNNKGWVCLDYCKKVSAPVQSPKPKPSTNSNSRKATGIYEVTASALKVRTGPGAGYRRKSKNELTTDGQKHANSNGGLLQGTRVTVSKWSGNWALIPSGWVSGDYLKKV